MQGKGQMKCELGPAHPLMLGLQEETTRMDRGALPGPASHLGGRLIGDLLAPHDTCPRNVRERLWARATLGLQWVCQGSLWIRPFCPG